MKWYIWILLIATGLILGYAIEKNGETCDACKKRKKDWFGLE